jgi:ABC-2 type transport system ATP-binding protein
MIQIKFSDGMDVGMSIIRSSPHLRDVQVEDHSAVVEWVGNDEDVSELLRQLVHQGVGVRSFSEKDPTLEDVFMLVTKGLVS